MPEQLEELIGIWSAATCRRFESGVVPPHSKVALPVLDVSWVAPKLVMSAKTRHPSDPQNAASRPPPV